MNVQAYLDRIGYRGALRPDLPVLVALQRAHICAVPFENLDVQFGRPVTTSSVQPSKVILHQSSS